ncbi:DUF3592 domain-containing protein [Streptomyces sp. NBC_01481]|uniref:DUF3592 domain-containing protein n=1 Tax=Streptomyces sp. NBC_01481 TaxID=2975869 RepID=UPI00224E9C38|nr:DUF3592 domain-containing protein [Streptomyces sp. NBC_01481]MCX4586025.1 DUF3592 domain-containing protein [Streptomyces sp. NBC_01481]
MLAALACGAAALLVLGAALRETVVVRRLRQHGTRTQGVVVDNVRSSDSEGPTWVPVIAFTDLNGHRVEFAPRARGTGLGLATGREVGVVYLPHAPQTARVLMWRHLVGPPVSLFIGGIVFLGFAVWIALTD